MYRINHSKEAMVPRKPTTDQKRLPKKTRAKKPPVFQMTERDIELVRAVSKYRYLYVEQVLLALSE